MAPLSAGARAHSCYPCHVQVPDLVGTSIRSIRILERIGEGGMGRVYLGLDEKLGRRVAVKAVRADIRLGPVARERFLREARVLSQLEHPNICRIYDFIESDQGEFIVLELVSGSNLHDAVARGMSFSAKLAAAEQVAAALVAAHSLSVVHRDLKPENIMLTAEGVVKVLDFGLARADGEPEPPPPATETATLPPGDRATLTQLGDVMGTPRFMSPEQARGQAVTAASDMYSFGLVLQELFTGRPAYEEGLDAAALVHRAQWADTLPVADLDTELATLVKQLKAITPRDRPSAVAAAEQLRRVRERPRRRLLRLAAVTAAAGLLVGAAALGVGLVHARRSLAAAEEARAEAEAVNAFLRDMLGSAEPGDRGREVKVVDILDRASATVEGRYADHPTRLAVLLHTLGYTYASLGHYAKARDLLRHAAAIWRQEVGELDTRQLDTLELLGNAESDAGNYARALALRRLVWQRRREALGTRHPMTLRSLVSTAASLTTLGRFEEAEGMQREALAGLVETVGPEDRDTMAARNSLAITLYRLGRLPEAEALHRENLTLRERVLGPEHPQTINSLGNLVPILADQGKHDEALELSRREVMLRTRVQGERHPGTLIARGNTVLVLSMLGRHAEAEAEGRAALQELRSRLGGEHPFTLMVASAVAAAVAGQGRLAEAEQMQRETFAAMERVLGVDHPTTLEATETLASILVSMHRRAEAETLLRHLVEARGRVLGPSHVGTVRAERQLAQLLATGGDVAEPPQPRPPGSSKPSG
jgi:eukaryotic-like serine/threonine-protein kinase